MLIVGAKGFAKELVNAIVETSESERLVLYDDVSPGTATKLFDKYRILRTVREAEDYFHKTDKRFILGIGSPRLRFELHDKFVKLGGQPTSFFAHNCSIGRFQNHIGLGSCVLGNAIIEANNIIAEGCLIHVAVFVSHDVTVGKFCEISPYSKLLGGVEVGDFCRLGTGCIILPQVKLGNNVVVGAGAVVSKNVPDNTTVVGVPAKPLIK